MSRYPMLPLLAQIPWQWHEGGHMSMHWGWWILWTALFLVLVWLAFNPSARRGAGPPKEEPRESVEETLRRRFAQGEIDEEEFERRMRMVKESRGGQSHSD